MANLLQLSEKNFSHSECVQLSRTLDIGNRRTASEENVRVELMIFLPY